MVRVESAAQTGLTTTRRLNLEWRLSLGTDNALLAGLVGSNFGSETAIRCLKSFSLKTSDIALAWPKPIGMAMGDSLAITGKTRCCVFVRDAGYKYPR